MLLLKNFNSQHDRVAILSTPEQVFRRKYLITILLGIAVSLCFRFFGLLQSMGQDATWLSFAGLLTNYSIIFFVFMGGILNEAVLVTADQSRSFLKRRVVPAIRTTLHLGVLHVTSSLFFLVFELLPQIVPALMPEGYMAPHSMSWDMAFASFRQKLFSVDMWVFLWIALITSEQISIGLCARFHGRSRWRGIIIAITAFQAGLIAYSPYVLLLLTLKGYISEFIASRSANVCYLLALGLSLILMILSAHRTRCASCSSACAIPYGIDRLCPSCGKPLGLWLRH